MLNTNLLKRQEEILQQQGSLVITEGTAALQARSLELENAKKAVKETGKQKQGNRVQ